MGQQAKNNFNKQFGDRIQAVYAQNLLPSEKELQNKRLCEAALMVLTGILGRAPTERELFGLDDLTKAKRHK